MFRRIGILAVFALWSLGAMAQDNRIDTIRPNAPILAQLGQQAVGVKTLQLINPSQINVLKTEAGKAPPIYDRPLTVELWYPAKLAVGQEAKGEYRAIIRDGKTEVTLFGKAVREAQPDMAGAPYPLIVLSHGYPGNRFLMSHFGENLASKGYVVASVDHTESTYSDQAAFGSTLLNRPLDQLFVVNELDKLSRGNHGMGLKGLINADSTGLIGYSMGGYGALNAVGGGFTAASTALNFAPPGKLLSYRQSGNPQYTATLDKRIKTAIVIGPWGWNAGFWDGDTLKGIKTPLLFMAGSADDISGYSPGIRNIFEASVNAERYLLTFENAKHNAAAPMPAPKETLKTTTAEHYTDAVWDTALMNNIAQHFATAWFGKYLKGDASMDAFLNLPQTGNWKGFGETKGLKLEYKKPAQ
jgi:predicted dienelactone hydrolase